MTWAQPLAQELSHAVGAAKKRSVGLNASSTVLLSFKAILKKSGGLRPLNRGCGGRDTFACLDGCCLRLSFQPFLVKVNHEEMQAEY